MGLIQVDSYVPHIIIDYYFRLRFGPHLMVYGATPDMMDAVQCIWTDAMIEHQCGTSE